ncbi:N-terminal phage integrase SAM-like domain-containing protein [Raineyella fluvialis]|uniref:N-terminal phage integrase SAM-like domain-containing protein n=1 Tax=Raineyella fluvialis TaxID=2662261 RepID=UPI001E4BC3BC|nr:N-terminal phage integrase SAM-like domain-containing protein [Raineyella fluvialis]
MGKRRGWGTIRVQRSGRLQAEYTGPDLLKHHASTTFTARVDAETWLAGERRLVERGAWTPPETRGDDEEPPLTLRMYAEQWLADRDLKPRTREHYRKLLDKQILPTLGDRELAAITPLVVRSWWSGLGSDTPTQRAHAYSLLRTVMNTALGEQLIMSQPCHVRGRGRRRQSTRPGQRPWTS